MGTKTGRNTASKHVRKLSHDARPLGIKNIFKKGRKKEEEFRLDSNDSSLIFAGVSDFGNYKKKRLM